MRAARSRGRVVARLQLTVALSLTAALAATTLAHASAAQISTAVAPTIAGDQGYWLIGADGGVFPFGTARGFGSLGGRTLNQPVVGIAPTPDGGGYWLVAADGGVFPFGNAGGFGSTGGIHLNQPIVAMASTADGRGYWLVARDGGVFPFGDAIGYGSTGNVHLNQPIVGMAGTPDGRGYWLVASDGGIFPFGDAGGYGSTGGIHLNQSITNMTSTRDGKGYWLCARDGGIFPFGDAIGYGSTGGIHLNRPISTMAGTPDGRGYWLGATDGGIFPFGDAIGLGSLANHHLNAPILAVVAAPAIGLISLGGGGPITADMGAVGVPLTFALTRAGGIPVAGASLAFSLNGLPQGTLSTATGTTGLNGRATVILHDVAAGDAGSVVATDQSTGSQATAPAVTVSAGAPANVAVNPTSASTVSADGTVIIATVRDAESNPIPALAVNFTAQFPHTESVSPATALTNNAGQASTLLVSGTVNDVGTVTAAVPAGPSATTGQLTIVAGAAKNLTVTPVAATTQSADASCASGVCPAAAAPITFTLVDANNNAIAGQVITPALGGFTSATVAPSSGVTDSLGHAVFTIHDARAGDAGTLSGSTAVGQSAATPVITIVPGAYNHFSVPAPYNGITVAAGAAAPPITINTFDAENNAADPVGHSFIGGGTALAKSPNGQVGTVVVTPTAVAGAPHLSFTAYTAQSGATLTLDNVAVGQGITVTPGAGGPLITSPSSGYNPSTQTLTITSAGEQVTFNLSDIDLYGNIVYTGVVNIKATGHDGGTEPATVTLDATGHGSFVYTASASTPTGSNKGRLSFDHGFAAITVID